MKLNDADKIYRGTALASAVYAGAVKVWPEDTAPVLKNMVVLFTPTGDRNDYAGWVGLHFYPEVTMRVSKIGKFVKAGNTGTHYVSLRKRPPMPPTELRTVSINMTGSTPGTFQYVDVEPFAVNPGDALLLMGKVTGADLQYWSDLATTTLQDAADNTSAYTGDAWNVVIPGLGVPDGMSYIGLDLVYEEVTGTSTTGAWDASYKSAPTYLFNQNKTLTNTWGGSSTDYTARGTTSRGGTDKVYFEGKFHQINEHTNSIGLANSSVPTGGFPGMSDNNGVTLLVYEGQAGFAANSSGTAQFFGAPSAYVPNSVYGIYCDMALRKVWLAMNGVIFSGNPVTNTGGFEFVSAGTGPMYPWSLQKSLGPSVPATILSLNTKAFAYPPLAPYTSWDA